MKYLLPATAIIELGAGLALLCVPSSAVQAVFGAPLTGASAVALGRLAGAALLALAIAAGLASRDAQSHATLGFTAAMALYNFGAVLILGASGILTPPAGFLLWPGVVLHVVMAAWCLGCLCRARRGREASGAPRAPYNPD